MKLALALLVLGSLVAAGCGGPADPPAPTSPPETPIAAMDFESGKAEGEATAAEGEEAEPGDVASPDDETSGSAPEGDQ